MRQANDAQMYLRFLQNPSRRDKILAPMTRSQFASFALALFAVPALAQTPSELAKQEAPELLTIYKQLHQAPELSHHEEKTFGLLPGELRNLCYEVNEHVGK